MYVEEGFTELSRNPSSVNHGFQVNVKTNKLMSLWSEGYVIPQELLDILAREGTDTVEQEVRISNKIHVNT